MCLSFVSIFQIRDWQSQYSCNIGPPPDKAPWSFQNSKISQLPPQTSSVASSGSGDSLEVFTTRPDTLFGATYMVIAPEHPQLQKLTTTENESEVQAYIKAAASKSDLERTELQKEKSGVFTGTLRS